MGEALTEVFALSGQVDRAIEMGKALLARVGGQPGSVRVAALHLGIARAAIAGGRWAEAAASVEIARRSAGADTANHVCCLSLSKPSNKTASQRIWLARSLSRDTGSPWAGRSAP